jgi:H+/Cl- antiporter ClcA
MFRSNRVRGQVRLLALAGVVGIVAGIGGIAFYVATRLVEHYALGALAGYHPEPHPGGEPSFAWLVAWDHPLYLWLLLLMPTVGGLISGVLVGSDPKPCPGISFPVFANAPILSC